MFVLISIAGAIIAVAVYWDIFLFFCNKNSIFDQNDLDPTIAAYKSAHVYFLIMLGHALLLRLKLIVLN